MARTVLTAESRPARYFWQLRRFPMLEPQEEYTLAQSWCEYGDRNAAHRLVTSHLRLVIKIAKGYRGYGLPISDVISEGNVGLMQALERFEPEKGFQARDLCRMVDQGSNPGIHFALLVAGEDRHCDQSEEAILQSA